MNIVVHLSGYYDWEPVPEGVEVTKQDVARQMVKPAMNGGYMMRVEKTLETHTQVSLPEAQLIAMIVADAVREKRAHTRSSALAAYLGRHVMGHHAHKKWMRSFEVDDDGPDETMLRGALIPIVAAGLIEDEDIQGLVDAYLAPGDHVRELRDYFGVKEEVPS